MIVVSGSRHINNYALLLQAIEESGFMPSAIVHGNASGVDALASRYAKQNSLQEIKFPADWSTHGKAAGPRRNSEMIDYAKKHNAYFIAIWDGKSRGTFDCLKKAYAAHLPIYVKCIPSPDVQNLDAKS